MRKKYEFGFSLFWVEAGKPNVPGGGKKGNGPKRKEGYSKEKEVTYQSNTDEC